MRLPFTLEQANKIAADFQHLIGVELYKGRQDTAVRYIAIGPYDPEEHVAFATKFHLQSGKSAPYISPTGEYEVLCIGVYDTGYCFVFDLRLIIEEYKIPYEADVMYQY